MKKKIKKIIKIKNNILWVIFFLIILYNKIK